MNPAHGKFTFEWFDRIMDKMQANGIWVILDIPGTPAPIWQHRTYPGVDIIAQNGTRLPPAERDMDDISDPTVCKHDRGKEDDLHAGTRRGILTNRVYEGSVVLGPLETDLVQRRTQQP